MEQISIGCVVKLKSGSPNMTVTGYGKKYGAGKILINLEEDKEQVKCQWFDATGTLQQDTFPVASLQLA